MRPKIRSAGAAALMLVIAPAIVGLLACMPVPIGDPERSRIDPEISGVWVGLEDGDKVSFFVFEPYDKRTWLLTGFSMDDGDRAEGKDYDLSTYAGLTKLMETEPIGPAGVTVSRVSLYKVWRTKLGGRWFMTWEPKGLIEADGFVPEAWYAFRIDKPDANTLDLRWVKDALFKDVEETRRAYERVIRKNAGNPDLYDDEAIRLLRADSEYVDFVGKLARQVITE